MLYLLECTDGSLYAGITPDLAARYAKHCAGRGGAYTRSHPPRRILAVMPCADRGAATRAEIALKKQPRAEKLRWAQQWAWSGADDGG
ncbi:MAG TPA: GIY-YIG nuclease family protein [Solimonas sp.]|nr:GIY-YIG nuclease family protein [Solimonas sp.]